MFLVNLRPSLFTLLLAGLSVFASAQKNPGFLGKKTAVGYSLLYSPIPNGFFDYSQPTMQFTNAFYIERCVSRYLSFSASLMKKKMNLPYDKLEDGYLDIVYENYEYQGDGYQVEYEMTGGYTTYDLTSFGLRTNFYFRNKSVAAPEGFSGFVKMDFNQKKAVANHFVYEIRDPWQYSTEELENAKMPAIANTGSNSISVGAGLDRRYVVFNPIYLRLHGEFNFGTSTFANLFDSSIGINDDLRQRGRKLETTRSLFMFGMGVGVML